MCIRDRLYSCENLTAYQTLVPMNIGTPTPMRGPGIVPGLFPLESAMDELAIKLNLDPLELLEELRRTGRELQPRPPLLQQTSASAIKPAPRSSAGQSERPRSAP